MEAQGRCYCGAVRYKASGDPVIQAQCHCRECQYVSGGSPNVTMGMPEAGFAYTQGAPKQFRRKDLPQPVTREFCSECGTQILTRAPAVPGVVLLKGRDARRSERLRAADGDLPGRQAAVPPGARRDKDLRALPRLTVEARARRRRPALALEDPRDGRSRSPPLEGARRAAPA